MATENSAFNALTGVSVGSNANVVIDANRNANLANIDANNFIGSGNLTSSNAHIIGTTVIDGSTDFNPPTSVEYLVVAGGGGGGAQYAGGGGGGGLLTGSASVSSGIYSITVGAGGSGGSDYVSERSCGNASAIGSYICAMGGGNGGADRSGRTCRGAGHPDGNLLRTHEEGLRADAPADTSIWGTDTQSGFRRWDDHCERTQRFCADSRGRSETGRSTLRHLGRTYTVRNRAQPGETRWTSHPGLRVHRQAVGGMGGREFWRQIADQRHDRCTINR